LHIKISPELNQPAILFRLLTVLLISLGDSSLGETQVISRGLEDTQVLEEPDGGTSDVKVLGHNVSFTD
jgi:hypothetical protein